MKSLIGLAQALNERYAVTEQIPGSSSTGSVRTCWIACSRLADKASFSVIAAMHVSAEKNTMVQNAAKREVAFPATGRVR